MALALAAVLLIFIAAIAAAVYYQMHHQSPAGTASTQQSGPVMSKAQKDAALAKYKVTLAAQDAAKAEATKAAADAAKNLPVYKPLYNWDSTGNSIEDRDVASAKECEKLCSSDANCSYYVTDSGGTSCSMKKAGAPTWKFDIDKITHATDAARQGWGGTNLPYDSTPGFDTAGTDISESKNSPADCGAACASDPNCEYFVTDADGSCWLRSAQKSVSGNANRSTYVRPGRPAMGKKFAPYFKWDASSSDLGQQTNNPPDACAFMCMNTNGCKMYVTDAAGSLCWLKGGGDPSYKPDANRILYVPIDPAKPTSGLQLPYDRHAGYDTPGDDLGSKQLNPSDCSAACASTKSCDFFVTNQNSDQCWLKANPGKPFKSQDRNTFVPKGAGFQA